MTIHIQMLQDIATHARAMADSIRVGNGTQYDRITAAKDGSTFGWVATAENGWHHVQHRAGGKPQYFRKRDLGDAEALRGRQGDHALRTVHALKLLLLSYNGAHCTLMTRVVAKHDAKDFVLTGAQSGVLYISKLPVEKNILLGLKRKAKPFEEAYKMLEGCHGSVEIRNLSSTQMIEPDRSVDFVFTDPPFGDFIPYAEVNQINELWLPAVTERAEEVII